MFFDKQEDYDVEFAIVAERIYGSGCLEKVNVSFHGLLFGDSGLFTSVDCNCRQNFLSRLSDRVHTSEAYIKRLSGEGRNTYDDIIVARISL